MPTMRFGNIQDYKQLAEFYKNDVQKDALREILSSKSDTSKLVVAEENGNIVGKLILYLLPWTAGKKSGNRAIIAEVFVKEQDRRKGIARAMIEFCMRETNAEDIQIDRVEKENVGAIALYQKIFPKSKLVFSK